jgi:hypothetical protein
MRPGAGCHVAKFQVGVQPQNDLQRIPPDRVRDDIGTLGDYTVLADDA